MQRRMMDTPEARRQAPTSRISSEYFRKLEEENNRLNSRVEDLKLAIVVVFIVAVGTIMFLYFNNNFG